MYNNNMPAMQPWNHHDSHGDAGDAKGTCLKFMNFYVIGHLADGSQIEGIIEDADDEDVTMLVPEMVDEEELNSNRQFGGYGGYDGFGWYNGFGGGYRRRFRRFRRRRFPYRAFVFPFILPFPFY